MHFRNRDILQDVNRERFPGCRWTDVGGVPRKEKTTSGLPPLSIKASVGVAFSPNLLLISPVSRPSHLFTVIHVLLASMLVKAHTGSQKRTHTPNNLLHSFQVFIPSEQSGLHQPKCDLSHFETFGQLYTESWRIQTHTLLCIWHVFLLSYYILPSNSGGLRAKQCFMSLKLTTSCIYVLLATHSLRLSFLLVVTHCLLLQVSVYLISVSSHMSALQLPSTGLSQRLSVPLSVLTSNVKVYNAFLTNKWICHWWALEVCVIFYFP